jgi:hypothetical protein
MRNFIIILFVFFLILLIGLLFVSDPLIFFLAIFMALIIVTICLFAYLNALRGLIIVICFIFLPFLLDYLFAKLHLPFFNKPLIENIFTTSPSQLITINNLYSIFALPLLLMAALFFAKKIQLFSGIRNHIKFFIALFSSILFSLNFIYIKAGIFDYQQFCRWLLIALIVNYLLYKIYNFDIDALVIYKEVPIIIFLALYAIGALQKLDMVLLSICGLLTIYYVITLANQYRLKKFSQHA